MIKHIPHQFQQFTSLYFSKANFSLQNCSTISFNFKSPVLLVKNAALNMLSNWKNQSLTRSLRLILYSWKSPENGSVRGVPSLPLLGCAHCAESTSARYNQHAAPPVGQSPETAWVT